MASSNTKQTVVLDRQKGSGTGMHDGRHRPLSHAARSSSASNSSSRRRKRSSSSRSHNRRKKYRRSKGRRARAASENRCEQPRRSRGDARTQQRARRQGGIARPPISGWTQAGAVSDVKEGLYGRCGGAMYDTFTSPVRSKRTCCDHRVR